MFYTRTSLFTASILDISQQFDLNGVDLLNQIRLLTKLKNFEMAREAYDLESEVCESMYTLIKSYDASPRKSENADRIRCNQQTNTRDLASVPIGRSNTLLRSKNMDNDIDGCFHAYENAHNRLLSSIGASRSLLAGMLGYMRAGAQERKRQLHNMVAAEVAHLDEIEEKYQEEKRALDAADREEWISEQQSYNRKILYPLPTDPAALVAIYWVDKEGNTVDDPAPALLTVIL